MAGPLARLRAWQEAIPVTDPLERGHALTLQGVCLVGAVGLAAIETAKLVRGGAAALSVASLANTLIAAVLLATLALLRAGRPRAGKVLMVGGFSGVLFVFIGVWGLEYSRDTLRVVAITLPLAALLLGRRALWVTYLAFSVALAVGLARDHGLLGGSGPALRTDTAETVLASALVSFLVLALVVDRFGLTVGEALDDANRKRRELEALSAELARSNAALSAEAAERARVEAQLLQAQKMEAIARFSGGIAHDFNNVLGAILGFSELVRQSLPEGDALRRDLDEVVEAAHRGAALTRQLLAFTRRQVIRPEVLDVAERVRGLERMLRRILGEDVALRIEAAPGPWPVSMDPVQLEQVLLNLASNARDAMPEGGTLVISVAGAEVAPGSPDAAAGVPPGAHVVLAVADSGTGMDEATLARLFEPFFTTKPPGRGTGLGLSTCRGIARGAGGEIRVETAPGGGCTFRVFLPRSASAPVRYTRGPDAAPRGGSETILAVEDDGPLRSLVGRTLRARGYRVIEAGSVAEALASAPPSTAPLHLLLADVVLPDGNGRALADRLRLARPGLRVLYASAYAEHAALSTERDRLLAKPYSPDDLSRAVREALDAEGPVAPGR